jgi:hypothetical protein
MHITYLTCVRCTDLSTGLPEPYMKRPFPYRFRLILKGQYHLSLSHRFHLFRPRFVLRLYLPNRDTTRICGQYSQCPTIYFNSLFRPHNRIYILTHEKASAGSIMDCMRQETPMYFHFAFQMSRFLALLHIHMALFFYSADILKAGFYLKYLSMKTSRVLRYHRTFHFIFCLQFRQHRPQRIGRTIQRALRNPLSILFFPICPMTRSGQRT